MDENVVLVEVAKLKPHPDNGFYFDERQTKSDSLKKTLKQRRKPLMKRKNTLPKEN